MDVTHKWIIMPQFRTSHGPLTSKHLDELAAAAGPPSIQTRQGCRPGGYRPRTRGRGRVRAAAASRPFLRAADRARGRRMRVAGDINRRRCEHVGCSRHDRTGGSDWIDDPGSVGRAGGARAHRDRRAVLAAAPARIRGIRRGVVIMKRVAMTAALAVIVTLPMVSGRVVFAQNQSDPQALRREIEQRCEVLPLRSSLVLTPKDRRRDFHSIEITESAINVDGTPATG